MKKVILLIAALTFGYFVQAQQVQESKVPVKVKTAFTKKNPGATSVVHWEKQKNNYKATYTQENSETASLYNPDGQLIEREVTVSLDEISANVKDYIASAEPKKPIEHVAIVLAEASGNKTYKLQVNGYYYYFDSKNEAFLRKVKR